MPADQQISSDQADGLAAAALAARSNAYAPYSKFRVGAALLADDGRVYRGVNVENSSYGLTICAERVAIGAAIADGAAAFRAVAIASDGGHAPCGACRQVLFEFGGGLEVILIDAACGSPRDASGWRRATLAQMLPDGFRLGGG
ncbi:MAG: cytidine deaminase [Planctomycetota bacterium]